MSKNRPFTDNAGFTRHCWECVHARGWHRGQFSHADVAVCELTGKGVGKFYSPNNQCSHVGVECHYETGEKRLGIRLHHDAPTSTALLPQLWKGSRE